MVPSLTNRTKLPIGIEVGADTLRLVQLSRTRAGWSLVGAFEAPLPMGDDPRAGLDELAAALTEGVTAAVASSRFKGRNATLALRDGLVRSRTVRQPRMSDNERTKVTALEGPARLEFEDGQPTVVASVRAGEVGKGDEARDEIIYVGGLTRILEAIVEAVRRGGLMVTAIEPTFIAAARGATPPWQREAGAPLETIVHIGRDKTNVTLAREGDVAFHKSFPVGGHDMALAAAERLGVDLDAAQDIRAQRLRYTWNPRERAATDQKVDRALFEATRPIMSKIGQEISLCLRHHGTTFRGARPERCVLIGQAALEPRLSEIIQESTRTPTVVAHPLRGADMTAAVGAIERRMPQPQLVPAMGVGLRGLGAKASRPGDGFVAEALDEPTIAPPANSISTEAA